MLGGFANQFMKDLDALRTVAITHFSGPRVKPWARLPCETSKKLTASGIEYLLNEDDVSFRQRFPENPHLPTTGAEKSGRGYPTTVVKLVREWTDALRSLVDHLQKKQGIDLVQMLHAVDAQTPNTLRLWNRSVCVMLALMLCEIISFVVRRCTNYRLGSGMLVSHALSQINKRLRHMGPSRATKLA